MNALRLRAVLYARVSGPSDHSVADQLAELRRWASRESHEVVAEHSDDGISASRFAKVKTRPGWQAVLAAVADGTVNAVALWEQSRATRDRGVWAALVEACIEAGAVLVVAGKIVDLSDPDGAFMGDLSAALAVRESAMTRRRVLRAVEARAAEGHWAGKVNFGYRIEYDPQTGRPLRRVPDEVAAPVVREVVERLLAGESAFSLAKELNERGITGRQRGGWSGAHLVRTVSKPAMAGLRVHRGVVLDDVELPGPHVLDRATYDRLRVLLADPSRKVTRTGTAVRMLTGVATCAECGGAIGAATRKSAHARWTVYRCRGSYCVSLHADRADEVVADLLVEFLSRPDVAAHLVADDPAAAEAAEEAVGLRAELSEARELHRQRRLSLTAYADLETWLLPQIEKLDAQARPRHIPDAVLEMVGADDIQARWEATPTAQQKAIVKALLTVQIGRSRPGREFDRGAVRVARRK